MTPLRLLKNYPDLFRLIGCRLTGTLASQMLLVALGWQMYDLTHSAMQLGYVGLAQFLPQLIFALPAGQWVDRYDRRRLLGMALGLQAMVALVLAATSFGGRTSAVLILSVSVALGLARTLQMPAMQALLPMLVPKEALPRALALGSSVNQGAVITGPALGGALYAVGSQLGEFQGGLQGAHHGAATVYTVACVLLSIAALLTLLIRYRPDKARPIQRGFKEFVSGIQFVARNKVVLGAISLDLFAVLLGGATALLPIFARDILHMGPEGLGLLRAAPAVGALSMGIFLAYWPIRRRSGYWLMTAVAVFGLATLGFALARQFWPAWIALAITGAADMVSVVLRQSFVQLCTPDAMRGRVAAVNSIFIGTSNQLGEFESGLTAAYFGPVGSVALGGVGTLLVALAWCFLFPQLRRQDTMPEAAE